MLSLIDPLYFHPRFFAIMFLKRNESKFCDRMQGLIYFQVWHYIYRIIYDHFDPPITTLHLLLTPPLPLLLHPIYYLCMPVFSILLPSYFTIFCIYIYELIFYKGERHGRL